MMNRQQARALAFLAIAARPEGAQEWDETGVLANLAKVRDLPLADVVIATMRAAANPDVRTPGIIPARASRIWQNLPSDRLSDPRERNDLDQPPSSADEMDG